jgi:hypothetical protein
MLVSNGVSYGGEVAEMKEMEESRLFANRINP